MKSLISQIVFLMTKIKRMVTNDKQSALYSLRYEIKASLKEQKDWSKMSDQTQRINEIVEQIETLQNELASLEGLPNIIKPTPSSILRLQKACENYLLSFIDGEEDLEDERCYVFDVAMEFTYGNIRDWIVNRK